MYESNGRAARMAYSNEGARGPESRMGYIEAYNMVKRGEQCPKESPLFCFETWAPQIHFDLCCSYNNRFGVYDYDQMWDWGEWYVEEALNKDAGIVAGQFYWDLTFDRFWVSSIRIVPNIFDTTLGYDDCDPRD